MSTTCVRCGINPASVRFCATCADALVDATRHLATYATDLRAENESLRVENGDLREALKECSRRLAAGRGVP